MLSDFRGVQLLRIVAEFCFNCEEGTRNCELLFEQLLWLLHITCIALLCGTVYCDMVELQRNFADYPRSPLCVCVCVCVCVLEVRDSFC